MNTLKISINKITKCLVISKKIGKYNCMRFFFVGYNLKFNSLFESHVDIHHHIQIYTENYKKYINTFFTELQETITI